MRPLPENFPANLSRASTYDIVQRVRCEAHEGLKRFKSDEHAKLIIAATSIGYDFEFDMTEANNATDGDLSFIRKPSNKASKSSVSVNLTGEATRTRRNVRTFRVIEDLADVAKADCSMAADARRNLAYPIAGTIGMAELVGTYTDLEKLSDLKDPDKSAAIFGALENLKSPKTAVFSEHFEFKTTLTASATPTLQLSAVAGSFKLTNASFTGMAQRRDHHSLIVAFALDPKFEDPKVTSAKKQRSEMSGTVVRGARTETAFAQRNVDAQNRVLLELQRLRNLKDDEREGARFLGKRLLKFLQPPDDVGSDDQP